MKAPLPETAETDEVVTIERADGPYTMRTGRTIPATAKPTRREVWKEIRNGIIPIQHVVREPFTVVCVTAWYGGHQYHGWGFSKQNRYGPTADEWDTEAGYNRAAGRAMKDLLDTIMAAVKGDA